MREQHNFKNITMFNNKIIKSKLKRAFTLVELIVVIAILAILWVISFITLQWYSQETKDVKRISDLKSLYTKITLEYVKWIPYSEMVIEEQENELKIGWKDVKWKQWIVNFEKLKENQKSFQDPKWYDYIIWYTNGNLPTTPKVNSQTSSYNFIQLAATSEKTWKAIVVWNYYEIGKWDSLSILREWSWTWEYIVNEWIIGPYDIWVSSSLSSSS
jgi:prepilin-type N-terminal cleavage/methylation domain-containing protein